MGKYGSRWLGDNVSTLKHIPYSIYGTMMMNIFGIPLAGADICGFGDDTTDQLCTKWHYVGAFYTFSRNHNAGDKDQEPYTFKGDIDGRPIMDYMREAIQIKYAMLRYYYSYMFMMSTEGTGILY